METVRVRVVLEDPDLLNKTQNSEGLRRSWLLLKPQHKTISDLSSYLLRIFNLHDFCPNGLLLSVCPLLYLLLTLIPAITLFMLLFINQHHILDDFILVLTFQFITQLLILLYIEWRRRNCVLRLVGNLALSLICVDFYNCFFFLGVFNLTHSINYFGFIFWADGWLCFALFWVHLYFEGQGDH